MTSAAAENPGGMARTGDTGNGPSGNGPAGDGYAWTLPHVVPFVLAGIPFGIGLAVSGMTDPAKVKGFLDLAGVWDPSLAFVMGGALAVAAVGFFLLPRALRKPLVYGSYCPAKQKAPSLRLVAGAALFGVGWGLGGLCPGPAIADLASGQGVVYAFVPSMLLGMFLAQKLAGADREG